MENVRVDAIDPPLSEFCVRVLGIDAIAHDGFVFVHHPASWDAPYMVRAYDDGRYDRRGNFRAVVMDERHVESAYAARRARSEHARELLASVDFGAIDRTEPVLRVALSAVNPRPTPSS